MLRVAATKVIQAAKPAVRAGLGATVQNVDVRAFGRDWTSWRQDNWQVVIDFYVNQFNEDMDHWQMRKCLYELHCMDFIPDPPIVEAVFRACRRLNDHSLAVRYLESLVIKCHGWNLHPGITSKKKHLDVYRWLVQEMRPVMNEMGISAPEDLGYDKPEFFRPSDEWWERDWYDHYPNIKNHKFYQYVDNNVLPSDGSAGL